MPTYLIKIEQPHFETQTMERRRFDAFQFQGRQAVYDVADRQGLRDTQAAHNALARVNDMGRGGLENIQLGAAWIILNS